MAATLAVPRLCAANRPIRIDDRERRHVVAEGGLASLSPSTAESTEIAGVITLSPRNIAAPMTPTMKTKAVRRPSARLASAVSESVPPSPLLSARSRISTYFSVTVTISAHKISDNTPSTMPRVTTWSVAGRHRRLAKGVKRAGADVAIDDADAAERQRHKARRRFSAAIGDCWPRRKPRSRSRHHSSRLFRSAAGTGRRALYHRQLRENTGHFPRPVDPRSNGVRNLTGHFTGSNRPESAALPASR